MIKLVVGLGNPGKKYENTRHNIGFIILDELSRKLNCNFNSSKFNALVAESLIPEGKIVLMKPLTFMNLSGSSISSFLSFYKDEEIELIIVYDELDLPFARIKFARKGSSGGHNGIKSIIDHLNSKEFNRLRIGIDKPIIKEQTASYVLGQFNSEEKKQLGFLVENAADAILYFLDHGIDESMNRFHSLG